MRSRYLLLASVVVSAIGFFGYFAIGHYLDLRRPHDIGEGISLSGQLDADDVVELAHHGYRTIVDLRHRW